MSEQVAVFQPFEQDNKFFIKAFLLDASTNLNRWGVTERALRRDLQSFVGKPFVITEDFSHPDEAEQEEYRRGTIREVGIDQSSGKAYAVIEITSPEAIEQIKNGTVRFVSPSIGVEPEDATRMGDWEVIDKFTGYHLAGVKDPAFGVVKAQIKGQCTGTAVTCTMQLRQVQASVSSPILPSKDNQPMADGAPVTPDYSAEIKQLTASLESVKAENATLKARLDGAIKQPYIARILTAKEELGEIKAEEKPIETESLAKLDAENLSTLANQFDAAVKAKKEAIAVPQRGYRIQANASREAPKNGDEWLARLKRGEL